MAQKFKFQFKQKKTEPILKFDDSSVQSLTLSNNRRSTIVFNNPLGGLLAIMPCLLLQYSKILVNHFSSVNKKKPDKNLSGVIGVTSLASIENSDIGNYQEHFINDDLGYTVRLSNGRITMSLEIAQDFESNGFNLKEKRIMNVANSFIKEVH